MIKRESIERVQEVDLIEILEKYNLQDFKKAGVNYKAFSPFGTEKSPSFVASRVKQVWKCFSSGKGGLGAISFVMVKENCSWIEAVEKVAAMANIILEREEVSQEEADRQEQIEKERRVLQAASDKYRANLQVLPETHWVSMMLEHRGYQPLTLEQFLVGFSTENSNEITSPLKEKGRLSDGIAVGIVKEGEGGRTYDFFNNRLMFPIQDGRGRVVSFGGRASNEATEKNTKIPKYLNGRDTNHYKKEFILYGLFQSRNAIVRQNYAYLVEGYTDVIGFHDKDVQNVVATCGTALTEGHLKLLKKLCSHIIIVRDGDKAGLAAANRDIDLCLAAGLKVSVIQMPANEDPDSISKREGENLAQWLGNHTQDALEWKTSKLRNESANPDEISEAVSSVAGSLLLIKDSIKRIEYAKVCAKKLKVPTRDLTARVDELLEAQENNKKLAKAIYEDEKAELIAFGFPEAGDVAQFKRDGYVIDPTHKCLYFKTERESFFKGTNFIVNPLFVIRSAKGEGKRLVEFSNAMGEQTVFALNNKEISNYSQFKERIVDGYNFTFEGNVSNLHFTQFRNKLLYNFKSAHELYTLGQQPEGFFALTNGVIYNNEFFPVDEYGIVDVTIEADEEAGKPAIEETFYSPACSKINLAGRGEDDDAFEGVREFAFKESEVNFNQWMDMMYKVYGEKAMIGIAFNIAAIYRDIIVTQFSTFPHLYLAGQRQSGKTTFSESLTWLFTPGRKSFDLNTGTMVGFFRMVSRVKNIVVGLEEYTDQIHEAKFQTLKAAFDNRGRETGNVSGDKSTTVTKVQSACIILSQYLSTRDDNSLTSRSIPLNFHEQNYTPDQKLTYARLKSFERKGMTSLLMELLKHRKEIQANLSTVIEELNRELIGSIKTDYMERMLNNFISIMAPVKILEKKFAMPFTWKEFYDTCKEMIVSASDMISETEGTAKFWQTLEFLVDNRRIVRGNEFLIDPKAAFKFSLSKSEEKEFVNVAGDDILFLRLGKVHQDYVETVSKRKGEEPIGEATLRTYFKSKPYYIGPVKAIHFENGSGSCYAFNYTVMEKMGIVNLVRNFKVAKEAGYNDPAKVEAAMAGYDDSDPVII